MVAEPAFSMSPLLSPDSKWYCLRTQPKHEHIAAAHLRLRPEVEVFCPQVRLLRSTRRGPVWFTESLFPNYLFARFDFALLHAQVHYSPGVSRILRFGTKYADVPEVAIEHLRTAMGGAELKTISSSIGAGDDVEIVRGPLRGETGVVTQILPARERVKVLLEFLGGTNEVELELTAVFKEAPLPV
jgi:transcriptional antiterminator RfaH